MISFSCTRCGQKFKVKPEFAGRATQCPGCKQALVVPQPQLEATVGIPIERIEGLESSVVKAGVDAGITLDGEEAAGPSRKSIKELLARRGRSAERYVIEGEIARGGMGAVLRAVDCDIRREVAVKYLLNQTDAQNKARFVEEAQITGQLEHPNIPPLHELGVDKQNRLFFAMKMVRGRSLAQVLDELRNNPKAAEKDWPLSRLVTVFVSICNALAYAHSRGVIHRDLKPANVMVGDFGEVYVMDWGLAKVLAEGPAAASAASPSGEDQTKPESKAAEFSQFMRGGEDATVAGATPPPPPARTSSPAPSASKVVTSREEDADLTQQGAILGTPAYMPPEQALGRIDAVDQRSDVYSLGAILYELLSLVAPVAKEGGFRAVLKRVIEEPPVAPEKRNLSRAIPRELSAVAMKALAKESSERYQSVAALRQDVERYQEGRSVSAKADSVGELLWKMVKRNKGASAASLAGAVVAALILVVSFQYNYQARVRAESARKTAQAAQQQAEQNFDAYHAEQEAKRKQARDSVPALVRAARLLVIDKQLDDALGQVKQATDFDPDYAPAHLLKGQLLLSRRQFTAAQPELEQFLKAKPKDPDVRKLVELCRRAVAGDVQYVAFAEILNRQELGPLAGPLAHSADVNVKTNQERLALFQQRVEAAWPGSGKELRINNDGQFELSLGARKLKDLTPLKGLPLTTLSMDCSGVKDLSPLQVMPLRHLDLTSLEDRDWSFLRELKLTSFRAQGNTSSGFSDLTLLRGMPLTHLDVYQCPIRDWTPLRGMKLTSLNVGRTEFTDLTPLRGMPLMRLSFHESGKVIDLAPLTGMPLTHLVLWDCSKIKDVTPLKGMPLTFLSMGFCSHVKDLTLLSGMPLEWLDLHVCGPFTDLTPLKGMPLKFLAILGSPQVTDLTPLDGLDLEQVHFRPKDVNQGLEVLRRMKSLRSISPDNGRTYEATEFWKRYDAGEFKK